MCYAISHPEAVFSPQTEILVEFSIFVFFLKPYSAIWGNIFFICQKFHVEERGSGPECRFILISVNRGNETQIIHFKSTLWTFKKSSNHYNG